MRGLAMVLASVLAACAAPTVQSKGGLLTPFAEAGVSAPSTAPRRHAVLVGIDAFEDRRFSALRYAGEDARAMGAALRGFDTVTVLAGEESTSRAAILQAIHRLESVVTRADDTVVVYFSTHGSLARRPGGELERFLVARDTRLDVVDSTGLAVRDVTAALDRLVSRRKALFLATCHSGSGKSAFGDSLSRALMGAKGPAPIEEVSEAMIVASAAAFGEEARESEQLGHDIYTYYLLEALRHGDRDQDGAVTVGEAHDWARNRTYAFSQGQQRPYLESAVLGVDPIVLTGKRDRSALPVLFSYAPSAEGLEVRIDGQSKGVLPGGVAVPPGARRLELRTLSSGELVYAGEIELGPGERADLTAVLPRPARVSVAAQGGVWAPSGLPALFRGGAEVVFAPGPFAVSAGASYLRGQRAVSQNTAVIDGVELALGAGLELSLADRWALGTRLQAGLVLARQDIDGATFTAHETLRGLHLSARAQALFHVAGPLDLALGADVGMLWASLAGDHGPHPSIGASLGVVLLSGDR